MEPQQLRQALKDSLGWFSSRQNGEIAHALQSGGTSSCIFCPLCPSRRPGSVPSRNDQNPIVSSHCSCCASSPRYFLEEFDGPWVRALFVVRKDVREKNTSPVQPWSFIPWYAMQGELVTRRTQFSSCDECRRSRVACDASTRSKTTSDDNEDEDVSCSRCLNRRKPCTFKVG